MSHSFVNILIKDLQMNFEPKNIHLLYYTFDEKNNIFYKKENKSDFYISKELLMVSNLLEKHNIKFEIDKDHNILIKQFS